MNRELKEFLELYESQITEEEYEAYICEINNNCYLDVCELADVLKDNNVNLDKV